MLEMMDQNTAGCHGFEYLLPREAARDPLLQAIPQRTLSTRSGTAPMGHHLRRLQVCARRSVWRGGRRALATAVVVPATHLNGRRSILHQLTNRTSHRCTATSRRGCISRRWSCHSTVAARTVQLTGIFKS